MVIFTLPQVTIASRSRPVERDRERDYIIITMSTNQHQPPSKRTRFEEPTDEAAPSKSAKPPKSLAESFIRSSIASLHPQQAPLVEKLGKTHILLLSKRDHFKTVLQRMINDNDFIPRSARLKFNLTGSDRAAELPEYKQLAEDTSTLVNEFQQTLKEQIIKATRLEVAAAENEIRLHLAKCMRIITSSFLISENDPNNVDQQVHLLAQRAIVALSINAPMDLNTFVRIYKEVHTIETFPPQNVNINNNNMNEDDLSDSIAVGYLQQNHQEFGDNHSVSTDNTTPTAPTAPTLPPLSDTLKEVKKCIEKVFVTSWLQFKQQQQENKVALELKKLNTTFFTEKATNESVLPVDSEPAADKKELKALIHYETIKETKNLSKQLDDLKKQLAILTSSKNKNQRGRGGASSKQTNHPAAPKPSSKKKKNSKPKGKEKVVGNNNEKDKEKKKLKTPPGKQQSSKKGSKSNNKRRSASKKSNKK